MRRLAFSKLAVHLVFPLAASLPACTCDESLGKLKATIKVEPAMLDFGQVAVDSVKQLEVTVSNEGTLRLQLTSFTADAPFIAPSGTSSVATGGMTKVKIGFKPTMLGPVSGMMVIATSVEAEPTVTIPLMGTGIQAAVRVDPPIVEFGDVLWNGMTQPQHKTVTVSNPGTDSFDLTGIDLTDPAGGVFALDRMSAVKTYAPHDMGTLDVSYTPNARADLNSALIIHTTAPAPENEITVPIHAKAVGPEIELCGNVDGMPEACITGGNRPKVDFLTPRMGMSHGQLRAKNIGDRDLTISAMLVNGQATEFAFVPAPGPTSIVIPPMMDATWSVTYTPQDYTFDSVIVSFASDSSSGLQSIRVEGDVIRPNLEIIPRSMTFSHMGNIPRGQTHVSMYNCGTAPLNLSSITVRNLSGPTQAFSIENVPAGGTVIQPQPMCSMGPQGAGFDVVFATTTAGNYTGAVDVVSDDPLEPTITVQAAGTKTD